jgi:peptide/nickel transport system ATP-binding protein
MLFITHDLAVVAHVADAIAVMYLGKLMEKGSRNQVLEPPYHPYTEALLSAYPSIERDDRQAAIRLSGQIPSPVNLPTGCPFHSRCPRIIGSICQDVVPPWQRGHNGHAVACHIPLAELAMIQTMPAGFLDSHTEDGK